jgi:hypothetical protein
MSGTDAAELLAATRAFLREELLPALEGFKAYSTRVAANNLAIVARELAQGHELRAIDEGIAERYGLDASAGPVAAQLARALRDGTVEPDAELVTLLRRRALKAIEIDNPRYSGYLLARQRFQQENGSEDSA